MHRAPRTARGFTLMELIVVIAIVAILAGVAIFSVVSSRDQRAMQEWTSDIAAVMREARSRATASGTRYAVEIEIGRTRLGLNGARAAFYSLEADIGTAAMPPRIALTKVLIYFLPDGTMDSNLTNTELDGFTVYLQHDTQDKFKARVAVLPFSADIRTYDSWDE
jgi:prepilin-type N-terminal cleavage/methylation domain-containing protein